MARVTPNECDMNFPPGEHSERLVCGTCPGFSWCLHRTGAISATQRLRREPFFQSPFPQAPVLFRQPPCPPKRPPSPRPAPRISPSGISKSSKPPISRKTRRRAAAWSSSRGATAFGSSSSSSSTASSRPPATRTPTSRCSSRCPIWKRKPSTPRASPPSARWSPTTGWRR